MSKWLPGRLTIGFYLVGLAQIAVIWLGFAAVIEASRPERWPRNEAGRAFLAARLITPALSDPAALEVELHVLQEHLRVEATVIDPSGAVLASSAERAPRCADLPAPEGDPHAPRCTTAELVFPDGGAGHVEVTVPGWPKPPRFANRVVPIVLIVVGVFSLLLTRWVTRPLRKIARAARAFGRGDLAARARVTRRDELGHVAQAFDEMADRIRELLRSEKELLANISHELRTPLARIRVALDIASEGDAEVARESLVDIAGDLDELERLITDVLIAARLDLGDASYEPGVPPLRREQVDPAELLARAASRFRAAHPGRPLHVDVPDFLPAIDGDPVLLRRVVDNLLENAHRYSDRPAEPVRLRARTESRLEIEVEDRGIGIAEEDLQHVFRPFFRADRSRTRATGGLGLGLALAKRIVGAHGGEITLTSQKGEGTRARVVLPIAGRTPEARSE